MDLGGPSAQVNMCKADLYVCPEIRAQHLARVAQWIRRWSTKPKIPGSIPGAGCGVLYSHFWLGFSEASLVSPRLFPL